jgi:outer membrane biosynthesis protein TonB
MNRLQKKCLVSSSALHGLLLALLLVGPAFIRSRPEAEPRQTGVFLVIDSARIVDGNLSGGGGNPNARPLPPSPEPKPAQPVPTPPRETPKPNPEPVAQPRETPQPSPTPPATTPDHSASAKAASPKIKVNPNVIVRKGGGPNEPKVAALPKSSSRGATSRAAAQKLESTVRETLRNLEGGLSSGTVVDIPGPGGEAYASYRDAVRSRYYDAWLPPEEIEDDSLTAVAEVVVRRDGRIMSPSVLMQSTGVATFDHSVKQALERVRYAGLPPFPDGAKDDERTFLIRFNLKSKRLSA